MARCGYETHREYYLNDRGVQMGLFAASLAARKAGEDVPDDGYVGDYIREWAAEMPDDADPHAWGYERVKRDLRDSLAAIGVEFDEWASEQDLTDSGAVAAALDDLRPTASSTTPTARCGCARPTSATTRTGSS